MHNEKKAVGMIETLQRRPAGFAQRVGLVVALLGDDDHRACEEADALLIDMRSLTAAPA